MCLASLLVMCLVIWSFTIRHITTKASKQASEVYDQDRAVLDALMGDVAWLRGCLSGFFTFIPSITFKRSVKTWTMWHDCTDEWAVSFHLGVSVLHLSDSWSHAWFTLLLIVPLYPYYLSSHIQGSVLTHFLACFLFPFSFLLLFIWNTRLPCLRYFSL